MYSNRRGATAKRYFHGQCFAQWAKRARSLKPYDITQVEGYDKVGESDRDELKGNSKKPRVAVAAASVLMCRFVCSVL